jgi:spore maturation protein SpmA
MNRVFAFLFLFAFAVAGFRTVRPEATTPSEVAEQPAPAPVGVPSASSALPETAKPSPADSPMKKGGEAILDKAGKAVDLAIGLVGVMAFFLGLVAIAEDAGALTFLARLIRPLMVRLFPDVPADHPAMSAMILNLSANALGLANAATPFGLKAMRELDRLNPHRGTASNAMVLFLAINTSSVTLIPTQAIAIRQAAGSRGPADIVATTLFATLCSTAGAVAFAWLAARVLPGPGAVTPPEDVRPLEDVAERDAPLPALPLSVSLMALGGTLLAIPAMVVFSDTLGPWLVPSLAAGIIGLGAWRGVDVYASFLRGAREAWDTAVRIVPYLVAVLTAVGFFQASGALDAIVSVLDPLTRPLGLPGEALPMALIRPLSGSGANGLLAATLADPATGPDTYTGLLVSTINGCSETTFYVLAVYFGSVGVHRYRHAIAAGLLADAFGVLGSVIAVQTFLAWRG